jgi:hypothetical protein
MSMLFRCGLYSVTALLKCPESDLLRYLNIRFALPVVISEMINYFRTCCLSRVDTGDVVHNDNCQVLEGDRSLFSKFMVSDEYARMSMRGIAGRGQRKEYLWTRSFPEFTAAFFRLE